MERLKLLIADGTEDFCMALADILRGSYTLRTCDDGVTALELMHTFCPDVVVLDLMLPGLDGITLLQRAAAGERNPIVLATTRFYNDYVLRSVQELGVAYIMVKPCDIRAVVDRLSDLEQRIRLPILAKPDPRSQVSNMLLALGIPTKLKGYGYLREAILLMAKDSTQSITKVLYPDVAAIYKKENLRIDAKHVERSIRSAIEYAWDRRDEVLWRMYFAAEENSLRRPSNGTFITRLAETMSREKEGERIPSDNEE